MKTFNEAWKEKADAGYQYGDDALEQVNFGWDIALAEVERWLRSDPDPEQWSNLVALADIIARKRTER